MVAVQESHNPDICCTPPMVASGVSLTECTAARYLGVDSHSLSGNKLPHILYLTSDLNSSHLMGWGLNSMTTHGLHLSKFF